jgi:hypothetical protein
LLVSTLLGGCATHGKPRPQLLAGSFSGHTPDGTPVILTFREDAQAFEGAGTVGDQPIVVAGAAGWHGVASLARAGGDQALASLELSADGERLVLETAGSAPWVLMRGGTPAAAPAGPFSGAYCARRDAARLADVSLVQRGPLLAGVARIAGDPAGISGHVTGPGAADGLVTFFDGSQVRFQAELTAGGRTLVVRGFGAAVTMERRSAR